MVIYPTIELQDTRPVSLFLGKLEEPQIWHVDPIEKAQEFSRAGASWVHITDFDAITGQVSLNKKLIEKLIIETPTPIQLGGGIRSMQRIEEWLEAGAGRIVIGTIATTNPDLVKEAAKRYPGQIALAVDVFEGFVVTHGWKRKTVFKAEDYVEYFKNDPLSSIIVTDIDADLGMSKDSLSLISKIARISMIPVIARGLVRSLDHLLQIKSVPHISGAIINRALFDQSFTIQEALAIALQDTGQNASSI